MSQQYQKHSERPRVTGTGGDGVSVDQWRHDGPQGTDWSEGDGDWVNGAGSVSAESSSERLEEVEQDEGLLNQTDLDEDETEELERRTVEILIENLKKEIQSLKDDIVISKEDLDKKEDAFAAVVFHYDKCKLCLKNLEDNIAQLNTRVEWYRKAILRREEKLREYARKEEETMELIRVEQETLLRKLKKDNIKWKAAIRMSDLDNQAVLYELEQVDEDSTNLRKMFKDLMENNDTPRSDMNLNSSTELTEDED